jgi:hypothetical protein
MVSGANEDGGEPSGIRLVGADADAPESWVGCSLPLELVALRCFLPCLSGTTFADISGPLEMKPVA